MKNRETFPQPVETARVALATRYEEPKVCCIRGDVFITMGSGETYEFRNLVVRDASILIARLMKSNVEPPFGIFCLAVGTGDTGWNPLNPPAATITQRSLYSEIARKTFAQTLFVDSGGAPTAIPTNVVDFTTTFTESEAVGPLCEMGLIGGNVSTNLAVRNPVLPPNGTYDPLVDLTTRETLVNYLTFPCVSKAPTSTMSVTWRLSF